MWSLLYFLVFWALHSFVFLSTFLCSLVIRVGATTNLEGGSGRSIDLPWFRLRDLLRILEIVP